ncbi:MAG TPA: hypothetical protein DCS29_02525 [Candidatus Magasanikbacteria bacterium]|nr:MAG: hypothetical protein A2479_04155 [Candidatus Magasanikbacteria bacterium RIFOXYC2_FULL_39_8]HAT03632.1 hypothetical protein [Candidatus Magasanikbacteria bacterium]
MIWQDIVITIASIIFSLALFPQVYYGFKNKKGAITHSTSVPTFLGLYVIAFVYFSLELYFSAGMSIITGTLWLIFCIQRIKYGKM